MKFYKEITKTPAKTDERFFIYSSYYEQFLSSGPLSLACVPFYSNPISPALSGGWR